MERGERDLRGADQEQLVALDLVDHLALAGEEARALERPLADQDRRHDGLEALRRGRGSTREAHERQLDHHEVADQIGEAGARDASAAFSISIQPVLRRRGRGGRGPRSRSSGRSPTSRRRDGVLVLSPSGASGSGGSAASGRARRGAPRPRRARPPCRLISPPSSRISAIGAVGVVALALGLGDRVGDGVLARRAPPRPRAAARGGARRASSSSSSASAAPRRASAARAGPGSSRIAFRSSDGRARRSRARLGGCRAESSRARRGVGVDLRAGVLGDEVGHGLGVVADDDVLRHDRAREPAVADREEGVLVVDRRAGRSWGPGCGGRGCRTPAPPRPSSVWQPEQRSAKSTAPSWSGRPRRPRFPRCRRRRATRPRRRERHEDGRGRTRAASYFRSDDGARPRPRTNSGARCSASPRRSPWSPRRATASPPGRPRTRSSRCRSIRR